MALSEATREGEWSSSAESKQGTRLEELPATGKAAGDQQDPEAGTPQKPSLGAPLRVSQDTRRWSVSRGLLPQTGSR